MTSLTAMISEIADEMRAETDRGQVANYIPPLASVDLGRFGMAIIDAEGASHTVGDAEEPFSVQSVSKVFGLTLALNAVDAGLWSRVRQEPSGSAFNSIIQLENEN